MLFGRVLHVQPPHRQSSEPFVETQPSEHPRLLGQIPMRMEPNLKSQARENKNTTKTLFSKHI